MKPSTAKPLFSANLLLRLLPAVGWMLLVAWLSLQSNPPTIEVSFVSWDKFQHAAAYGLLCLLTGWGLLPLFRRPFAPWLTAGALTIAIGGLLELAQATFTAVRAPEWGDLLADAVGAALVVAAAWWRGRGAR
ncbi:MAG: VanZ family protein [Desulfuromonadales bacterium]|nr:VanZ family protein [Desulfuromonadales bacterium]